MAENDRIIFPEVGTFEDPHTGQDVVGERFVSDTIESMETVEAFGGDEITRLDLSERGSTRMEKLGSRSAGKEVSAEDVFIEPQDTFDGPDPREVHQDRSEYAQKQDEARDARLTTDPEKYANDPDSWDFPGVDTGPTFRQQQDGFDSQSFLRQFF